MADNVRLGSASFRSLISKLNSVDSNIVQDSEHDQPEISCKYYECQDFKTSNSSSKFNFSALHLNISSLAKHFDELNALLGLLNLNFSVIGISETRFLKNSPPIFNFDIGGYTAVHTPTESSAGGALLYISNHLSYFPRSDLDNVLYKPKELESVFVEVSFSNKPNCIVGCIYKHPGMSVNSFTAEFLSPFLQLVSGENKSMVLLGDFNINLLNFDNSTEVGTFIDTLESYSLLPQVTLPTRITETSQTLIDNIFTTSIDRKCVSGNVLHSISDHLPQFFCISSAPFTGNGCENLSNVYKNWSQFQSEEFSRIFRSLDWREILSLENRNIETSFDAFLSNVNGLVDRHVPIATLTKKQRNKKPWITSEILKQMQIRDSYLRKYLNCKSESRNFYFSSFKRYRNLVVGLCRRSKAKYFDDYFHQNAKNIRKIWKGVKEIVSLKSSSTSKPISLRIDDIVTSNPEIVANSFNSYFSSVADKIRSKIPESNKHFTSFLKHPNLNSIFLSPVTPEEVQKIIHSMPLSKSSGPNSIPIKILKLVCKEISYPLTELVNLSFSTGQFPSALKLSKVIPIFKKGSPLQTSNYRPISLLSNIDKIFEKLMYSRVYSFLEANNVIYSRQFGFRKSYSTTHALISMVERLRRCLDDGNVAVGVFVDLQKAFDTVDHGILCHKLNHYGIRGIANKWFSSYLSSRQQFVSISNTDSNCLSIHHGVPQGSVLGPLLFLIYINDLHSCLKHSEATHFADDTNLIQIGKFIESLSLTMAYDLSCLSTWLSASKIALNAAKTEIIVFRNRLRPIGEINIIFDGHKLNPSSSIKYLGVFLDEHLNWNKHISDLCCKLRRANGALSKIRHYVPTNILLSVFHAIFNSHMRYACQLWAQSETVSTRRVLILQKCALRIISFSPPRSPSAPLFKRFEILTIFDLVKTLNILFVHQHLNFQLPPDLCNTIHFNKIDHSYPTRSQSLGLLKCPEVGTVWYGQKSLYIQSITQWNHIKRLHPYTSLTELSTKKIKLLAKLDLLNHY